MNRIVFLYSCDCFLGNGYNAVQNFHQCGGNEAVFGFDGIVMSTLYSHDAAALVDYNDQNGTLLMTDKLTGHVGALLGAMAGGTRARQALDAANNSCPPRTPAGSASGSPYTIYKMGLRNMKLSDGSDFATLHTIFKGFDGTSADCIVYGDWSLVFKEFTQMPQGIIPAPDEGGQGGS